MKDHESRKANTDGKGGKPQYTLLVVSLIAAFVIAALPMGSAIAAPIGPGGSKESSDSWSNKVKKLMGEVSIAQNMQTQPGKFCASSDQARYRDAYVSTLRAAQGLIVSGASSTIPVTGNSSNSSTTTNGNNNTTATGNGNSMGGYYASHPEKLLADYLHRLRQLREKINSGSDRNGNSNFGNASCIANTTGTSNGTGTGTGTGTGGTTPNPSPTPSSTPSPTPTP